MDTDVVVALLSVLLGAGGTGGVGLFVSMVRNYKKGKIEDDGTLIERLNSENKRLTAELAMERTGKMMWMNQAFRYRMQQVRAAPPITPDDIPELWSGQKPNM